MRTTIQRIALVSLLCSTGIAVAGEPYFNAGIAGQISPGVYGRIEIGNTPPPVIYAQPIIVVPAPRPVAVAPIYMHVPPGHAKKWHKHCHKYHACSQPVYFVKSPEYEGGGHPGKKHKHKD